MAHHWVEAGAMLTPRTTAWYAKAEATFSDVLAWVRRTVWAHKDCGTSADTNECLLFPKAAWDAVLDPLAATV